MAETLTLAFDLKRSQLDLSKFMSHEEYEIAAKSRPVPPLLNFEPCCRIY